MDHNKNVELTQRMAAQPIMNVHWIDTINLRANSWNPNVVLSPEMRLIKTSILTSGWVHPVLVNREFDHAQGEAPVEFFEIIDGFHRSTLCKTDKEVSALTGGCVPAVIFSLSVAERMMLTVRINRAKGTHQAFKMHDLVKALIVDHQVSPEELARGIGASQHEIQTLLMEDVFQKLDIENHKFSEAWRPRMKGE